MEVDLTDAGVGTTRAGATSGFGVFVEGRERLAAGVATTSARRFLGGIEGSNDEEGEGGGWVCYREGRGRREESR